MPHTLLIPDETRDRMALYLASLRNGECRAGKRLGDNLAGLNLAAVTEAQFLDALLNTKLPQIFAESAVAGDGSDWNLTELGLLGDLSIAVPVTVFDNGHHTAPVPHAQPFAGTLIFTPGALLCNGRGHQAADWAEVTTPGAAFALMDISSSTSGACYRCSCMWRRRPHTRAGPPCSQFPVLAAVSSPDHSGGC